MTTIGDMIIIPIARGKTCPWQHSKRSKLKNIIYFACCRPFKVFSQTLASGRWGINATSVPISPDQDDSPLSTTCRGPTPCSRWKGSWMVYNGPPNNGRESGACTSGKGCTLDPTALPDSTLYAAYGCVD